MPVAAASGVHDDDPAAPNSRRRRNPSRLHCMSKAERTKWQTAVLAKARQLQLERANAPSWARLDPCWSRDTKQGEQYEYVDTGASLRA